MLISKVIEVCSRIVRSKDAETIHANTVGLCIYPFPTGQIVQKVIIPAMSQPYASIKTRNEVFKIITNLKITSLSLLPALYSTLLSKDQSLQEKALEEIHMQLEFSNITESNIESLNYEQNSVCELIVNYCIDIFDHINEDIRVLALKVVFDLLESLPSDSKNTIEFEDLQNLRSQKPKVRKYVADEFEVRLLGDLKALVKKLVALILAENEGGFKDMAHECLVKIKCKRPVAIASECAEAKRGGFLKRWEYLDTLLAIPN